MNIAEKILAKASGKARVSPNEIVTAKIDMAMMPENFRLLATILETAGIPYDAFRIWDPDRFVVIIDHRVPPYSLATAENHKIIRSLARRLQVKYFYDVFPGICHQVMVEKGYVLPGSLIVGADSHTTTYGALNAAATGIGASEMAFVIYTGELWFKVPETLKIDVMGPLGEGVFSKDVILFLAGHYGTDLAQYKAIEWTGSGVEEMSLSARLTMSNMSVELGAKFGLFLADDKTVEYVKARTNRPFEIVKPDADAQYCEKLTVDGKNLEPQIALPHSVANVKKVAEIQDVKVDQAVIASCCHGRIEDLEIAARILKGKRVHPRVRFYVAPASWDEYRAAMEKGILGSLMDAGAMIGNPSCGFCTGFQGVLAKGERCIAAVPRNFKGRMGSPEAEVFLASPATVAASSITGKITDPREVI